MRPSGRAPDQMRTISFEPHFTRHAEGSVLVSFGDTRVLVTASVEEKVPPFLRGKGQGWVTAEYGMLPRATHTRGNREAARGKQSGRTQEIQRLIGRSLRAVVDLRDDRVGAVSCGVFEGTAVLDLDYAEDSSAGCDGNFVLTGDGLLVESQITAEGECFDEEGLLRLLRLARIGCAEIFAAQDRATGR